MSGSSDFGHTLAGAAFLVLGSLAVFGQRDLPHPGEACAQTCVPAPGYHFEMLGPDRIPVHDTASRDGTDAQFNLFMQDAGTFEKWSQLTNAQQQQILDGKQNIYAFVSKGNTP